MSMTIAEADAVMKLVGFLDGSYIGDEARGRADAAAQLLVARACKPLQLSRVVDVDELADALQWVQDIREDADTEYGDPIDLANMPCPVCGERGCEKPTQLVHRRFRHLEDVVVAGGRL